MKKSIFVLIILIVVLSACKQMSETDKVGSAAEPAAVEEIEEEKPIMVEDVEFPVEYRSLNDIQVSACEAANEAGTCDTRLDELGMVAKEECCEVLGVCC